MGVLDELLAHNAAYAAGFTASALTPAPTRRLAIITCMDARIDVHAVLGLPLGAAHVIRNPGAAVGDTELRALAISQRTMGTEEILVMRHTDCGMLSFNEAVFRDELHTETGEAPPWPAGEVIDLEAGLRAALARIEACPFLPHRDSVGGCVYDVSSGQVREVA
jgi:carbonic anhydrase